jgi:hypothetical protein
LGGASLLSALSTRRLELSSHHELEHGLKPDTCGVRNGTVRDLRESPGAERVRN